MSELTLVVLAAGMGSRYGGVKQIDRVGMEGETLLEYSVYDALISGFDRIVFVIRRSIASDFHDVVVSRMKGRFDYALCFQELDSFVDPIALGRARSRGRKKPWGTAHALLCAVSEVRGPFAVINADDFYGRPAFKAMGAFLGDEGKSHDGAIAAYRLEKTLSPAGSVSRGICRREGNYLTGVSEHPSIRLSDGRIVSENPAGDLVELSPETPVSMNFWGLPFEAMEGIRSRFHLFLDEHAGDVDAECYLPETIDALIRNRTLRIKILDVDSPWFGMTYRADKETSVKTIRELSRNGDYPAPLWRHS